ncbi:MULTISPECIES: Lpp/OprI family alanine-zipper lipoprotein [unclassified Vibrio]|uniref:Major outer membrane lipoprotein Lpp n=1 Tax=Vibrio sp. HB236076 TaxID=3232307 RepID=A0AB39HMP1_9VIBR|nr:Lpp/OprI family alanine-zipper lipoprotein [Vibrio sp. HB161653]MDP5252631.1 Lpp/OprI family alanine-zipper lipoprotein [Vibrio sp. HB161653]
MKKILIATAATSVLLLAGCASGPDEQTTSALSDIQTRLDSIEQDISSIKSQQADTNAKASQAAEAAAAAQEEASRANDRIDNIAQSYTK